LRRSQTLFLLEKTDFKLAKLDDFSTYENAYLVAPFASYTYLHSLDIQACRDLKRSQNLSREALKYAAYLLVTYAIEVRAGELYPIYQNALDKAKSKVNVK
jgi:hypothetical protein